MLEAAVGLINLDSDLQSSGNSTSSASPPDSDSDGAGCLVARPFAQEKYRYRSATKRFNALNLRNNASLQGVLEITRHFQDLPILYCPQMGQTELQEES